MPVRKLLFKHGIVIVIHHPLKQGMFGIVGLYHHQPAFMLASGPAAYLGHQLIASLQRPEIGVTHHPIRVKHAHQTYIVEIQAFGNHLGSHQYINPPRFKIPDDALIGIFGPRGVKVHPPDYRIREKNGKFLLHLLRAKPPHFYGRTVAFGTNIRNPGSVPAVMALHHIHLLVIGERNITVDALRNIMTGVAFQPERKSTTVLEKDNLFPCTQGLLDCIKQLR
ncbi:hypothetical protein DSECCO2_250640 [anaerobic digester metagenome]